MTHDSTCTFNIYWPKQNKNQKQNKAEKDIFVESEFNTWLRCAKIKWKNKIIKESFFHL